MKRSLLLPVLLVFSPLMSCAPVNQATEVPGFRSGQIWELSSSSSAYRMPPSTRFVVTSVSDDASADGKGSVVFRSEVDDDPARPVIGVYRQSPGIAVLYDFYPFSQGAKAMRICTLNVSMGQRKYAGFASHISNQQYLDFSKKYQGSDESTAHYAEEFTKAIDGKARAVILSSMAAEIGKDDVTPCQLEQLN